MTEGKNLAIGTEEIPVLAIQDQHVMLDADLAALYGVPTKVLLQAVRRNQERFPRDFCFPMECRDIVRLRSQIVTSKGRGGRRSTPVVFTEQGVAMLSSVLNSTRAIQANIEIMRAFVRMRRTMLANADLERRLDSLESRYDHQFKVVFEAIRKLMHGPTPKTRPIGFAIDKNHD